MPGPVRLAILSDIHYACKAEQARGGDYEFRTAANPASRLLLRAFRRLFWLRNPLQQNSLLTSFLGETAGLEHAVANGDFSCDTAFVGVSDDAACQSARECLGQLRAQFGAGLHAIIGDHELGKHSLMGARGGMRLASYQRATVDLGLEPFWKVRLGRYVLLGITSSLVALPAFEAETIPEELPEWERLRQRHLDQIREAFSSLQAKDRVLLFCHDPTALPFLGREPAVRRNLAHVEQTILGHLHSNLILWKSRILAGIPVVGFLGHPVKRISSALREARDWRPFRVRLCPSLAGVELLKDGGFYIASLDPDGEQPPQFFFHRLPR